MKKRFGLEAAIGFVLSMLAVAASAQDSGLVVCNRNESQTMVYAIIRSDRAGRDFSWRARAWHDLEPGACEIWRKGQFFEFYYVSVTFLEDRGGYIADYGVDEPPRLHTQSAAYGAEEFFCVTDGPFDRAVSDLAELKECVGSEYLQLFNLYVHVAARDRYTLNIR